LFQGRWLACVVIGPALQYPITIIGYEAAKIIAERIVENRLERKGGGTSIRQNSENLFIRVVAGRVAVFTSRFNAQRSLVNALRRTSQCW
jgi:hypothetical protein